MEQWVVATLAMGAYLVFAFGLGMMAGRGRSFLSVSEYAVADRGLGLVVMWFLMGGTVFSAFAFLGGPGWAFEKGAAAFYILAYTSVGLLPWFLIGPKSARIGARKNYITMGDLLGGRYRSRVLPVIAGAVAVLAFIQYLTLQIKGMAYVVEVMTGGHIPFWAGALIAYGVVVIYVATSGVRGAAWSDVLQGLMMLVIAWVLGLFLVYSLHGGVGPMFDEIIARDPDFLLIGEPGSKMSRTAYSSALLISAIGFIMWPHLFTKGYSTSERHIKLTILAFPVFALFLIPVLFIGFSAIGTVSLAEVGRADQILPYLVTEQLGSNGLLYGIIGAGALAAAMSSSDAITHGASVSFGRDVVRPLHQSMSEVAELWLMRASVVVIGAAAYALTIFGTEGLVQLLLGAYGAIAQFAPAVYGALYWRRGTASGAILGLVCGTGVNFYYQLVVGGGPFDLHPGLVGLAVNIVVFVGVSLMTTQQDEEHVRDFVEA